MGGETVSQKIARVAHELMDAHGEYANACHIIMNQQQVKESAKLKLDAARIDMEDILRGI